MLVDAVADLRSGGKSAATADAIAKYLTANSGDDVDQRSVRRLLRQAVAAGRIQHQRAHPHDSAGFYVVASS